MKASRLREAGHWGTQCWRRVPCLKEQSISCQKVKQKIKPTVTESRPEFLDPTQWQLIRHLRKPALHKQLQGPGTQRTQLWVCRAVEDRVGAEGTCCRNQSSGSAPFLLLGRVGGVSTQPALSLLNLPSVYFFTVISNSWEELPHSYTQIIQTIYKIILHDFKY